MNSEKIKNYFKKGRGLLLSILSILIVVIASLFFINKNTIIHSTLKNRDSKDGAISFSKSSFSCMENEIFETVIKTQSGKKSATVKSYESSNEDIATIDNKAINQVNCVGCKAVRVVCKKKGNVTLKAESSTGAKTTAKLTVKANDPSISYAKDSYTCKPGATIETVIQASGKSSVKSYSSSNTKVATIDTNTNSQVNCVNCLAVRIVCKNLGVTSLKAESSTGAKTTSSLSVKNEQTESTQEVTPVTEGSTDPTKTDIGRIYYENSHYSCNAGDTFETKITADGSSDPNLSVANFTVSDSSIATIDTKTSIVYKCPNCKAVRVVCKKKGNVTLEAKSSTGATTKSSLTVNDTTQQDTGSVSFEKSSYSCNVGDTFETDITASPGTSAVNYYATSDSSVATVDGNASYQNKCYNCKRVRVVCKKKGNITMKAGTTTGATTIVNLTVNDSEQQDAGTISFSNTSYSCKAGKTFETMITVSGARGAKVKSYSVSNTSYASIDTNTENQVNCTNCLMVRVTCKKKGNLKMQAYSSTGVKVTVPLTITD